MTCLKSALLITRLLVKENVVSVKKAGLGKIVTSLVVTLRVNMANVLILISVSVMMDGLRKIAVLLLVRTARMESASRLMFAFVIMDGMELLVMSRMPARLVFMGLRLDLILVNVLAPTQVYDARFPNAASATTAGA